MNVHQMRQLPCSSPPRWPSGDAFLIKYSLGYYAQVGGCCCKGQRVMTQPHQLFQACLPNSAHLEGWPTNRAVGRSASAGLVLRCQVACLLKQWSVVARAEYRVSNPGLGSKPHALSHPAPQGARTLEWDVRVLPQQAPTVPMFVAVMKEG